MKSKSQRRSQRQERYAALDIGGRVQVGSGSTEFAKGDVRKAGALRVECKTTIRNQYRMPFADILKIRDEALTQGMESWAYQIEFQGSAGFSKKIAVIDAAWFRDLGGVIEGEFTKSEKPEKGYTFKREEVHTDIGRPIGANIEAGRFSQYMRLVACSWETFVELFENRETNT